MKMSQFSNFVHNLKKSKQHHLVDSSFRLTNLQIWREQEGEKGEKERERGS